MIADVQFASEFCSESAFSALQFPARRILLTVAVPFALLLFFSSPLRFHFISLSWLLSVFAFVVVAVVVLLLGPKS